MFFWPHCKQTNYFFHMTLPTVEGIMKGLSPTGWYITKETLYTVTHIVLKPNLLHSIVLWITTPVKSCFTFSSRRDCANSFYFYLKYHKCITTFIHRENSSHNISVFLKKYSHVIDSSSILVIYVSMKKRDVSRSTIKNIGRKYNWVTLHIY